MMELFCENSLRLLAVKLFSQKKFYYRSHRSSTDKYTSEQRNFERTPWQMVSWKSWDSHFFYRNIKIFIEPQYIFLKYSYLSRSALLLTVSEKFHTRKTQIEQSKDTFA